MNNIIDCGAKKIMFGDLRQGECFFYNNSVYMKLDRVGVPMMNKEALPPLLYAIEPFNAVRLKDGVTDLLFFSDEVEKVDITIHYKRSITK